MLSLRPLCSTSAINIVQNATIFRV